MATSAFFIPCVNLMGAGCLQQAVETMRAYGYRKVLMVTDTGLVKTGLAGRVTELLGGVGIATVLFDGVHPNPTTANVGAGLALLREHGCDAVVSLVAVRRTTAPRASPWWQPMAARFRITRAWTSPPSRNCPWWRSTPPPAPRRK